MTDLSSEHEANIDFVTLEVIQLTFLLWTPHEKNGYIGDSSASS